MATLTWREAQGRRRAVALVVHGLNQRPECMGPLIDVLAAQGVGCVGLALRGHGDNYFAAGGLPSAAARLVSFQGVQPGVWLREAAAAYALARNLSEHAGVPLYLAAYSLGGLVLCDLMARDRTVCFDRMLLLAPALAIRLWTRVLRLLAWRPATVMRSYTPPGCRANQRGAPIAAYNAVFALVDHFAAHADGALDAPTLVLVDPADELVSVAWLEHLIAERRWSQWRLARINKTPPAEGEYHHLLVGPEAVGEATWARMAGLMVEHLGKG